MPMERSELKNNLESMEKKEDSLGVNICHVKFVVGNVRLLDN